MARLGQGRRATLPAATRRECTNLWSRTVLYGRYGGCTKQLEIAGYKDIKFEQVDAKVFVGKDLDDAVGFQLAIGPAGEVYREAGKLPKVGTTKSLRPSRRSSRSTKARTG